MQLINMNVEEHITKQFKEYIEENNKNRAAEIDSSKKESNKKAER